MRRVYQRRADTMMFIAIAAISLGVLAVYFTTHGQPARDDAAPAALTERPERLALVVVDEPARLTLERSVLADEMPHLLAALDAAQADGAGSIGDPLAADATWLKLADEYGAVPRVPLVVGFEGESYRLQMVR